MLCTSQLDMVNSITNEDMQDFIVNASWSIPTTHHMVLKAMPGHAIFRRDMLFGIPFLDDWSKIREFRQKQTDNNIECKNACRYDYNYAVGQQVKIHKEKKLHKAESQHVGP